MDSRIGCAYCKHATQIINPYNYDINNHCTAYPQGIPYSIQKRIGKHDKVSPLQVGTAVYESRQVYDMPDGKNYVTWEGEWVSSEAESKGDGPVIGARFVAVRGDGC